MANAIYNMAATLKLYELIQAAKEEGRFSTTSSGLSQLGSDDDTRKSVQVRLANDVVRRLLNGFPRIGLQAMDVAAVAGERTVSLAGVRQLDIRHMEWQDENGSADKSPITVISERDVMLLPYPFRLDGYSEPFPTYFSVDSVNNEDDEMTGSWYMKPAENRTATMYYRAPTTKFTTADLDSGTATVICPIPDDMISLVAMQLAAEFLRIIHGSVSTEYQAMKAQANVEQTDWQRRLAATRAETNNASLNNPGSPRTVTQQQAWGLNLLKGRI